jgi:rhodanese-related sulfurtransferase
MLNETRVSPTEAHRLMTTEGFTYLDVRTDAEFAMGHPEGAFNVPFLLESGAGMVPNPSFIEVVAGTFSKDTKLIVGCKAGGRSARATEALYAAGFLAVLDQNAGWDGHKGTFGELVTAGWSRCGLPVAAVAAPGRTYAELAELS